MTITSTRTTPTRTPPAAEAVLDALARLQVSAMTAAWIEAQVTPSSAAGSTYRVRCGPGAVWACSCPAAVYGGRRGEPCKHVFALRALVGALPEPLRGDWA